ncbi:MAG: FixH family protein [Phycisphaerales bacterium]|nr:FixH family protein [Phycisphaerales bacterium]
MIRFKPWPGIIFVLLAGNVVIVIITIVAAAISHSPIEPDYYRRAVEWDQVKALRTNPSPWVVTASRDAQGLRLTVKSEQGMPPNAGVSLTAQTQARDVYNDLTLEPIEAGEYRIASPVDGGELRVVVVSGTRVTVLRVPIPARSP